MSDTIGTPAIHKYGESAFRGRRQNQVRDTDEHDQHQREPTEDQDRNPHLAFQRRGVLFASNMIGAPYGIRILEFGAHGRKP